MGSPSQVGGSSALKATGSVSGSQSSPPLSDGKVVVQ